MLLKDFYKLKSLDKTAEGKYTACITINAAHDVFKGHFPGNPVTPGVCMMQIIKELTQQVANTPLTMKSASNVKFMALINPEVTPELKLELEIAGLDGEEIKVKNTTCFNDTVALKLSCNYSRN
ncbi:3-hydroxyacyl-ACP dehydratase [Flavobacterium rhizosphaerae]|uniref:3-hydroxyacyl-ACP dehydratase n=1 Tax=Flavobacterium rhizosphaerae TaxID=3163298 RepID=A0ABW8YZQ4_9FLAO